MENFDIILPIDLCVFQLKIDHTTVIINPDFFKKRIFLWWTI